MSRCRCRESELKLDKVEGRREGRLQPQFCRAHWSLDCITDPAAIDARFEMCDLLSSGQLAVEWNIYWWFISAISCQTRLAP